MSVAGAVFADCLYTQKLTDYICMGSMLGRQGGERSVLNVAVREVVKMFCALKICSGDLSKFYSNLELPHSVKCTSSKLIFCINCTEQAFPLALPAVSTSRTVHPSSLPQMFPFWKAFVWDGHHCTLLSTSQLASQYSTKMVFHADMSWSDNTGKSLTCLVVVKFMLSYCEEAHTLLTKHEPPLAPELYHCQKVTDVGDLYVVVMDYVAEEDGIDNTPISSAAVQQVDKAIRHLHNDGYVFGDL
ncbi:hypothetical protein BT96DRAFT_991223 [Gymnopus androsaceus JB14]|uniref:Protein kinase domain-containing protein n=1 Tax=Gymnopus androsaceus JB14 TaxID=1447944 RepID=A0A6A4HWT2_9AGAR|nr:hypothetical protein BT96DRAFT_991223 [Gymnopus androsaceus JB14]